ncbi:MAG: acyl-CoA dehydrogenase family protein [Cyanobacteriota bacterium]|nr:acyl-CoA dehydrogenase family protein [Cyanobacteriota bacterium]
MRSRTRNQQDQQPQFLAIAESYLREQVAPQAAAIDENPEALRVALQGLGDRALLALRTRDLPQSQENFYRFQELVARYSGALAFLQTQHQSAGSLLARSTNDPLKQELLPHMATGKVLVGVGFSQLRRPGEPLMKATAVEGGYRLDGTVPWVTGYGFFDFFIMGATLPTGEAIYGSVPLRDMNQPSGGSLRFSEPMQLLAMGSTRTVSARVEGWFLAGDRVVALQTRDLLQEKDRENVLHHSFFALGCARAGISILQDVARQKPLPFLSRAERSLDRELEDCRHLIYQALRAQPGNFEQRLQLRARAIDLAGRCARAAVTASSGAANLKPHPAERVYRESLMFAVSGQTPAVMEATLEQFLRDIPLASARSHL